MTVALLVGLFVTAAPVAAGTNAWSKFAIPSTTGMVLDTGDATGPMVMGSDGTIWAGRGTGAVNGLMTSTDFGATWAMVTTLTIGATNIMDISVSSIDPLQVYVTDGVDIYKTADGGTTWVTLSALTGVALITSLDVGYIGTDAYIFAGTSSFGGGTGGVYVAQEAVFGMPWSDMMVATDRAVAYGGADVTEVIVDPNTFGTTQMVMAVVTDPGVGTMVTTKYSGAQWDATVPGVTLPGVTGAPLYGTSTWLPSDFSSSLASGNMQFFMGVDSMTAAEGDVFWVIFGTPGTAFDLNVNGVTGMGVSSLDGIGPGNSASMLASGYSAGAITAPVVLASSAGGALWTANVKAPTGGATTLGTGTALSEVLIDPVTGNAIVATHGTDSAVSASSDWSVWNGVSLINAAIDAISDISVAGTTVCMVTNQTAGNIDSFWKNSGGTWMRILSSNTFGSSFDTHEYADGAHFLTDIGGTAIYRSLTDGATWATLVSAVPGPITAWQVVDANTIMVGGVGVVYQSTNGGVIWFTRTAGAAAITSFALEPVTGDILAGTAAPGVFLSTDNGATWTSQGTPGDLAAASVVGFSNAYDTKGAIYAAGTGATGGVWRKVGTGAWGRFDNEFDGTNGVDALADSGASVDGAFVAAATGMVQSAGGPEGMLYVADADGVSRFKCAAGQTDANSMAELMAAPAGATFMGAWYGDGAVWTIDTTGIALYTYTDGLALLPAANVAVSGVSAAGATISWDAVTGAASYKVSVIAGSSPPGRATGGTHGSVTSTITTGTTFTFAGAANTQYSFRVWVLTPVSTYHMQGESTFTTNPNPVTAPTGLAPAPAATNVPVMPTFQWNPPAGATPSGYLLEVSTVSDFATTLLSVAPPPAETYYAWQGDALDFGTVYYWRVTATGAGSSVPISSVFTTEAEAVDPVDVTTTTPPTITLTVPAAETPTYIWFIIAVGFVLTIAVIILIVRTRRVV
jgi:hypothetical protein